MEDALIQWHPAFDAAFQIELHDDASALTFEPEHLLSKKPIQMDLLVIKKVPHVQIHKNIGHIFKLHNIIEYKSPTDYLSINDFYKVYGYACLYQALTEKICEIKPENITITFVCSYYPREMLKNITLQRGITVEKYDEGIYYLNGDEFTMQLIVTTQLAKDENYWLYNLRDNLKSGGEIKDLIDHYEEHKSSPLYQAYIDAIARANWEEMEAEKKMCEALRELFADEFKESRESGKKEEADRIGRLNKRLLKENRLDDLSKSIDNADYRELLMKKYNID